MKSTAMIKMSRQEDKGRENLCGTDKIMGLRDGRLMMQLHRQGCDLQA